MTDHIGTADAGVLGDPAVLAVRRSLGAFPASAGLPVDPGLGRDRDARSALLAGRVPEWPAAWCAHGAALGGDRDGALAQLTGTDLVQPLQPVRHADPDGAESAGVDPAECARRWAFTGW